MKNIPINFDSTNKILKEIQRILITQSRKDKIIKLFKI
jgi:hypothetical protein